MDMEQTTSSSLGLDESNGNNIDGVANFSAESRLHISVNVTELERSVEFYRVFFGQNPVKVREGYAKFDIDEPALNFSLNEFPKHTRGEGHFGVQVKNSKFVADAWDRFKVAGFNLINEDDVECCYAVQTKLWVADPDGNRWEIFVTTEPDAEEGCGPDCICHQDFERSFVRSSDMLTTTSLVERNTMKTDITSGTPETAVQDSVKSLYADAAQNAHPGLCCPQPYENEYREHIPREAFDHNYGCGSPILKAGIKEGDTVVDLGSGVGIDCFVAAKLVGPNGKVIGIDMTDSMLEKAREFKKKVAATLGFDVVDFRKGAIEQVPIDDNSVNVVVSNCVLNLSPNKDKVFSEINRILVGGGKVVISDIVSDRDIAEEDQQNEQLWSKCYTGAMSVYRLLDTFTQNQFVGLTQLDEKPWKEVAGYNLGSLTLEAYKAPVPIGEEDMRRNLAIYLGPYATVIDEMGNEYERFKPVAISDSVADCLSLDAYANAFIVVKGNVSVDSGAESSSSCGSGSGCGCTSEVATATTAKLAKRDTPCCDPKDEVEPCCEDRSPKPDGSPCCDPYAIEQAAGCSCTQENGESAESAAVVAMARQSEPVSACCDSSSGCGDSGCGTTTSQQQVTHTTLAPTDDCCACETEAKVTNTDCCGSGCNTCGCE